MTKGSILWQNQDRGAADSFGKMMIEQCCIEAGCMLLNGRAPGDEQGACTRERHCIDYGIVSQAGYSTVHSFKVLPAEPISDHQPIECELVLHNLSMHVPGLVATEPPLAVPK